MKASLPDDLHIAHDWTESAGELETLRSASESEAVAYCVDSAANYTQHEGEQWPAGEVTREVLLDLWRWLRTADDSDQAMADAELDRGDGVSR